jgi:arylsulfatase A-like enzyme
MMRAWLSRAAGLFAGASIAALPAALGGGTSVPFSALLLPITVGHWLLATGLAVVMTLLSFSSALRPRLGGAGLWFAVGLAAGLVPLPLQLGLRPPLAFIAGAALALGIVLLAARRPPRLHPWVCGAIVLLTPAWTLASGFHHDGKLHEQLNAEVEDRLFLKELAADRPAAPASAPDVYLISIDTLRADALVGPRPVGYALPFLDALRRSGTSWEYGLSSSNQTVPGHAGMLLGRDALGTGVRWNHDSLPKAEFGQLLSERFFAAGFRTAGVISNGLLATAGGFNRGYDIYDDTTVAGRGAVAPALEHVESSSWLGWLLDPRVVEALLTETVYFSSTKPYRNQGQYGLLARGELTSNLALAALEQLYAQERPFFCFLHYMDPHSPYGAPPPFAGRLTGDLPPYAERYRPTARQGMFGIAEIDRAARDLRSDDAAVRAEAELAMRWFHLTYLEKLMFMDGQIQRIQERALASGRPAVWLVTSDHGEHFGEHGVVLHGNSLYEELVRVPFFMAGAGVPAEIQGQGVPRLEDVAPTLLALAGISPPKELKGRVLGTEGAAGAEVAHIAVDNRRVAYREGGWKLHGVWEGLSEVKAGVLFQLAADPAEAQAMPTPNPTGEKLLAALKELLARDFYPLRRDLSKPDSAQLRLLHELGYVDGLVEQ